MHLVTSHMKVPAVIDAPPFDRAPTDVARTGEQRNAGRVAAYPRGSDDEVIKIAHLRLRAAAVDVVFYEQRVDTVSGIGSDEV